MAVNVVHWNPRKQRNVGWLGRFLPRHPRPNNFGDLLGPVIVDKLVGDAGITVNPKRKHVRLLTVGSIIRMAEDGDVVWGSGVNGKSLHQSYLFRDLDVRAVRGPLTAEFLRKKGIDVPEVYGDPGLLVGRLWSREEFLDAGPEVPITVVPNLNDLVDFESSAHTLHPSTDLFVCMSRIARSQFVTGSSLHAIILAESWGIPARLIASSHEPSFKYEDYYFGSGRQGYAAAKNVHSAVEMGGEPAPIWQSKPLIDAFPYDLWTDS